MKLREMVKYRAWVDIILILAMTTNGIAVNKFTMLMVVCAGFLLANNVGQAIYDKELKD